MLILKKGEGTDFNHKLTLFHWQAFSVGLAWDEEVFCSWTWFQWVRGQNDERTV